LSAAVAAGFYSTPAFEIACYIIYRLRESEAGQALGKTSECKIANVANKGEKKIIPKRAIDHG